MNNQDIVSADRISELPEALILQILSHLPTEDAVVTTVLSKKWQSLWQMVPSLSFDSYNHSCEVGTFSKNVSKALLSHKAPVLQSLHLSICSHRCNAMDIGILIGIAFARNVRKLVLEVHKDRFTFPKSLYNCETLESLELKSKVLMDVPSSVCLKSLRTLHLDTADFKDDESVVNFFSGCPNLENLVLHRPDMSSVNTFTIMVSSLQRLTIYINGVNPLVGYVIKCPSLKYLKIVVIDIIGFCLIENVPELVKAELIVVSQITCEKLLESLTSVKRLSLILSPLKIKFPTGSIFDQLVYLELYTNNVACSNLLTLMLDSSPKLQVLKLMGCPGQRKNAGEKWNQPKNVPECLMFYLETFMWTDYQGKREDEIEVAKYILSNTKHLKRATFSSKDISSKDRLVVVKDLNSVVRASNSWIYGLKFCLIENTPKLVEANIIDVSDISNENILGSLSSSVRRLSLVLSPLKIKFPTGSIFHQLVYLELYTNTEAWWNLLTLMLDSSPKLQCLMLDSCPKLQFRNPIDRLSSSWAHWKWNQPNNVAECLLLHLETFVWNGYKEKLEEEIKVAKYILRNANCLKKATFSIKGLNSDERLEMLKELESVVRVSNSSCQLLLLK